MSEEVKSESEQKKEDWMNSKWRPMMGWMYMLVCTADFILFPVMWSLLQTFAKVPITQWMPLTLQGAGLFHIAMGAVLGIAAFGRTQEKLGGANNGGAQVSTTGFTGGAPAFSQPSTGFGAAPGSFGSPAPVTNSFGAQPLGGGSFGGAPSVPSTSFTSAPSWGSTPAVTASGKKIVPTEPDPVL